VAGGVAVSQNSELKRLIKETMFQKNMIKDLKAQNEKLVADLKSYWEEILWLRGKLRKFMTTPDAEERRELVTPTEPRSS
jgi:hypothetical protein